MNISTSDCSSGCESGWTTYLDQLSNSTDPYKRIDYNDDQDLSMVSDASSGPPHIQEYDNYEAGDHTTRYINYGYISSVSEDKKNKKKNNKVKDTKGAEWQNNLCLDDTASSSIFHFSQDNVPPCHAQNYSVEHGSQHFEGNSVTKKHFGFFKSSTKGKSGSLQGRKRQ